MTAAFEKALSSLSNIALRSTIRDDDGIDQLNHFVTVTLLMFFGAITGLKEYAANPIDCWNDGPYNFQHYQVPNIIWGELNSYSGSNIVKMVEMLQSVLFASDQEKKDKLRQVALFLEQWLRIHRKPHWFLRVKLSIHKGKETLSCCMLCVENNMDNYLSTVYLLIKGLFLTNIVMQFLLISAFLQLNFWNYGFVMIEAYSEPSAVTTTTPTFPLVALCHFQVYDTQHKGACGKWVQCILTINLFLEKLFLIEWFWFFLLLVVTSINTCVWLFRLLQTQTAINFVQRYMRLMGFYSQPVVMPSWCSVEQFVTEYLRNDGVFILRILAVNTNEVVTAELVEELWIRYVMMFKKEIRAAGVGSGLSELESSCQPEFAHKPDGTTLSESDLRVVSSVKTSADAEQEESSSDEDHKGTHV